jgi:hypothetical protein
MKTLVAVAILAMVIVPPALAKVKRLVIELLIFGVEKHRWAFALPILVRSSLLMWRRV